MKTKIASALTLCAAALIIAYAALREKPFLYSGVVEATEVALSPRLTAQIQKLETDEGQHVRAGQTLARLDCSEYLLALDLAKRDYERTRKLMQAGSASQEALDRARYQHDNAALKASWCDLKAPLDADVLYRHAEAGEFASPGGKIFTLADLSEVWAYVYVPQEKMSALKVGQEVAAVAPELGPRRFPGVISVINDKAEFTPKNVQTRKERTRLVFGVKLSFKNQDGALKPGMTLEAALP
ncbi:MAG: efflux RND transporter periplasmic adaptor subunit [Elusimicrobia bacterium]|nr:efflux RND transporter periplasmic adaptor subunit [Elusimicrobiota bacterium]